MSTGLLENELYLNFYSVNQVHRAIRERLIVAIPKIVFRILPPRLSESLRGSHSMPKFVLVAISYSELGGVYLFVGKSNGSLLPE